MASAIVSSKGQITIPLDIREEQGLDKGTKINIQSTPWGISIIKVPSKPLSKLKGILEGADFSSKDVKRLRQENDKTRERLYNI